MKRIHKISRLGACSFKHAPYLLLQYKLYSGIFCRGISWLLIGNSVLANEEQLTSRTLASWLFYCNSQRKCLNYCCKYGIRKYSSLFTFPLESPVFMGVSRGEEFLDTLHPLFTTLHHSSPWLVRRRVCHKFMIHPLLVVGRVRICCWKS